jgi:predicted ABC-type ATPase
MKFVATFKTDEGIDKTFEIGDNIGLDDAYRVVANNHLTTQSIEINPNMDYTRKMHLGGDMSKHLAPNGKPSNLNHEQWHMVRTQEFKNWFGDWENDPQSASKVVDENGEPLVVHHGTIVETNFDIFDYQKADLGFHFGTKEQAKNRVESKGVLPSRKSIVNSFFLNIRVLFEMSDAGEWQYPQRYIDELISDNIIEEKVAKQKGFLSLYGREDNAIVRDYIKSKYGSSVGFVYNNKYEGKGKSFIALSPNEIKLADGTNTTFDGNNPDIRYKKGGEMHKPKEENIFMNIKYYTPRDIEEKYKLSETEVGRLIEDGAEHELEHTSDYLLAVRIASSHLYENKNYYKKLKEMKLAMGGVVKHYAKDGLCLSIDNAFADGGKIPTYTKDYFKDMVKKGRMFDKGEYYSDAPFVKSFDYRNFVTFLYDDVAVWLYQEFGILLNEDFSFDYKGEKFIPSVKVADVKDGEVLKFTFIYNAIENDDKITYVVIDDDNNILHVVFNQQDADALAEMKNAYVEVQTEDEPIEKTIGMLQIDLKTNEVLFTNNRMDVSETTKFDDGGEVLDMPPKDENGERKIDQKSIEQLTEYINKLPQTKSKYYNEEINRYSTERRKLHAKIINKYKEDVVCITKGSPIAILMGGSPASGKSSFLKRYSPFLLKSEILKIDADEIRAKLPEYKGYNATQTHMETKDIVNTLISDKNIGIPCDFDLIYDGTMNSVKSYIPLIDMLQKRGYKIFIVYMDNVPKEVITKRILERYQKTGRFVPLEVVDDFFEKGRSAFDALKNQVDGYMVIDGSNQDYNIIQQGGIRLPRTRQYSKIGQKIDKKQFPKEYKKGGKA